MRRLLFVLLLLWTTIVRGQTASPSQFGTIKVGSGLAIDGSGVLSVTASGGSGTDTYGALTTYVSTKTRAGIQAALDAAPAYSTVVLSSTYACGDGAIYVNKPVHITGFNAWLDGGTTNHILMILAAQNVEIDHIGYKSMDTGSGYAMLLGNELYALKHVKIHDNEFTCPVGLYNAFSFTPYSENSSTGVLYEDIQIYDNYAHDLNRMFFELSAHSWNFSVWAKSVLLSRNRVFNSGLNSDDGMSVSFSCECQGVVLDANILDGFKAYGAEFIGPDGWTASNNILRSTKTQSNNDPSNGYNITDGNNTSGGNAGHGAKRGSITGGSVVVNGRPFLTRYAYDVNITGGYYKGYEISLQNSTRLTIANITYDSNGPSGIYFDGTSNSTVQGGKISTANAADPKYQQIAFVNGSANNWVWGTHLVGTPANGFNVYPGVGNDTNNNRWAVNIEGTGVQTNPATLLGTLNYTLLTNRPTLGTASALDVAASGNASTSQVVKGDDSRLTNSRTPTSHTHPLSDLTQSSATTGQVPTWNGSAWAPATPSGVVADPDYVFNGFTMFTGNTAPATGTVTVVSGYVYAFPSVALVTSTISTVAFRVTTAATGTIATNSGSNIANGIVLADISGNVLASVSTVTAIATANSYVLTLSNTVSITAGTKYIVFFRHESTGGSAALAAISQPGSVLNIGISAFPYRGNSKASATLANTGTIGLTGYNILNSIALFLFR